MAYCEKGNNIGSSCNNRILDTPSILYTKERVRELLANYGINNLFSFSKLFFYHKYSGNKVEDNKVYHEIMESKEIQEELLALRYFSYLDNFFKDEEMIKKYEGVFNTYMYIREYILSMIKRDSSFTFENIFDSFDEKKEIVVDNFKDICSYLLSVRELINGLRLSFGNTKIAYNSRKEDKEFTEYQRMFINGLAFGTTKEKLENGDYTDLSRIIYLPKNKVYQLTHKK